MNFLFARDTVRLNALLSTATFPPSLVSLDVNGRIRTATRTWEDSIVTRCGGQRTNDELYVLRKYLKRRVALLVVSTVLSTNFSRPFYSSSLPLNATTPSDHSLSELLSSSSLLSKALIKIACFFSSVPCFFLDLFIFLCTLTSSFS